MMSFDMSASEHTGNLSEACRNTMNIAALRFDGYRYIETKYPGEPEKFPDLTEPICESWQLHKSEYDNFAAFFALQRFLCKWGGEYLTWDSKEWKAYAFLFLHLYTRSPDPRFTHQEYLEQWRTAHAHSESAAAEIRRRFAEQAPRA